MKRSSPDLVGRTPGAVVPVYIAHGASARLPRLLGRPPRGGRLALVTDATVARLYGQLVRRELAAAGWKVDFHSLTPGERNKSAGVIAKLHDSWFRAGYDRATPVVALGGGTIGDAVGFAAATFRRGLPLWNVPTTIVGQVDSSLGGKVGINHAQGKNLVGCFYQPAGILIDPSFLGTLPAREIRSGLAEVEKYGIICDPTLFRHCERMLPDWISKSKAIDRDTIKRCAAIKLKIVQADEHDRGKRHILNFGHTLGHAFEAWGKYRMLRHGEAVAIGMLGVSHIGFERRTLSWRDFERIATLCRLLVPSVRMPWIAPSAIMSYLASDKKRLAGQNAWVLPRGIGRVTIARDVTDKEIKAAIDFVRLWLDSSK